MEANGQYYLNNLCKNRNNAKNGQKQLKLNKKLITYKKNGGYTLEFNQNECIWHLRSIYYGIIAYGMLNDKLLNNKYNCVWNVYYKYGDKNSLVTDENVSISPMPLSKNMIKYKNKEEIDTDSQQIKGEFEHIYHNDMNKEGFVMNEGSNAYWRNVIFGVSDNRRNVQLMSKKLELIGMFALAGIGVYYLWSKFKSNNVAPAVTVLQSFQTKSGILIPKNFF